MAADEWFVLAIVCEVVMVIINIVAPADDELAEENCEGDDVSGAFPPELGCEKKRDGGDQHRGAEVRGFGVGLDGGQLELAPSRCK